MKRFLHLAIASLVFALVLRAQPPLNPTTKFSGAPSSGDLLEYTEVLSTTAAQMCTRNTVAVTRTSGAVLAIGAACTATDRCFLRFPQESHNVAAATTTATIAGGGASDDGLVLIYATRTSATAHTIYIAYDLPAATITCAGSPGCTAAASTTRIPSDAIPIWSWIVTDGAFAVGGGTNLSPASDCWVDLITLTNKTGGAITVTAADVRSSALDLLTAVSLAANTTTVLSFPGGLKMENGFTMTASADDSINVKFRAIKK